MKKLLLISLVLIIGCATAPPRELQNSEVIDLPGISKNAIYTKSLKWIATTFQSANTVTQYKDAKEGSIVLQMITSTSSMGTPFDFKTTVTIDIKQNKAKISFHAKQLDQGRAGFREIYESEAELAQESFIPVIESYKNYMVGKSKKDDNW